MFQESETCTTGTLPLHEPLTKRWTMSLILQGSAFVKKHQGFSRDQMQAMTVPFSDYFTGVFGVPCSCISYTMIVVVKSC